MTYAEQIDRLNEMLLADMPHYRQQAARFSADIGDRRRLLRCLMNLRPPLPLDGAFLALQDAVLSAERDRKGIVDPGALPAAADPRLNLWQGDITRLAADAIVNAANSALLGCFHPGHGCIDNAIHSAAGLQLREACRRLMEAQGHEEPVGGAKITRGYNLPCGYVLHTVGPAVRGQPTRADKEALAGCYRACLELAGRNGLKSVAFCCISTGEFRFPQKQAARIAVETVRDWLDQNESGMRVIFDVFEDADRELYRELLGAG